MRLKIWSKSRRKSNRSSKKLSYTASSLSFIATSIFHLAEFRLGAPSRHKILRGGGLQQSSSGLKGQCAQNARRLHFLCCRPPHSEKVSRIHGQQPRGQLAPLLSSSAVPFAFSAFPSLPSF